ncbi:xylulokinase, partial [Burkholderia sp. Ax-1719]|nr:xylulokinase [Burkholderia sp. Ax-1719]
LGWLAAGGNFDAVLAKAPVTAEYTPDAARHAALRERLESYRALYRHVRPLFDPARERLA